MVRSEREMLREEDPAPTVQPERSTSLQPTYEDSVPQHADDWEIEDD